VITTATVRGNARIVEFRQFLAALLAGTNRLSRLGPTPYRRPSFVGHWTYRSGQRCIQLKTYRTGFYNPYPFRRTSCTSMVSEFLKMRLHVHNDEDAKDSP
jgi:hypothetical protein